MFACSGPFSVDIVRPPLKVLSAENVLAEYAFAIVDEELMYEFTLESK